MTIPTITAPWTDAKVEALNRYQHSGEFHPFTCGGERGDAAHREYASTHGDPDLGLLVATTTGWRCPACDYQQGYAYGFMMQAFDAAASSQPPQDHHGNGVEQGAQAPSSRPNTKVSP